MKKIFVLLIIAILGISTVFAYNYPRWKVMPINVFIPQNQGKYTMLMTKAFSTWQQKTNGLVRFKYVNKQSEADIYVEFVDYVTNCGSESAVGCCHNANRNGFFTQSYIQIGTKENAVTVNSKGKIVKQETGRTNNHLYGVMLHEIGHALGLEHSDSKNSIMYPIDLNELQYLTNVDLQLIKNKYN